MRDVGVISNPISKRLEGNHSWLGENGGLLNFSAEKADSWPNEYIHDPECPCGKWTTGEMRAWWADPLGKLIEEKECGCQSFQLGRHICLEH